MSSSATTHTPLHARAATTPSAARPGVRLTGRGQFLVLLALVLMLLGAFAIGRAASSQATEQASSAAPALTQVTVQPGDTLWAIARRVAPERDTREVVAQLRQLNHLPTAAVQAGSQLLLPAVV